jgi:hypothetical protein
MTTYAAMGLSVNANIVSNAASEVSVLYSVWHEFLHPGKQKIAPVTADTKTVQYVLNL